MPTDFRRLTVSVRLIPALVAGLLMALASGSLLANPPAGVLTFTHGEVTLRPGTDAPRPAQRGSEVFPGDTVETGRAASAQIRFTDGGTTAMRPQTVYRVDDYLMSQETPEASRKRSELVRGGLRVITGAIGEAAPGNVRYDTPVATMGIRGTVFELLHVDPVAGSMSDSPFSCWTQPGVRCWTGGEEWFEYGTYLKIESGAVAMTTDVDTIVLGPGDVSFAAAADRPPVLRPPAIKLFSDRDLQPRSLSEYEPELTAEQRRRLGL
jgi:hypothetical protein